MKQIPLTQGKFAKVDDEDYDYLMQWRWQVLHDREGGWYAQTTINYATVRMHRLIMKAPFGTEVDHINSDGLDNRKCNLRFCTRSQNQRNQKTRRKGTSSIYKGVWLQRNSKKWQAQITYNRRRIYLGCFTDEIEAAGAYDRRAIELFGEFARTNFPKRIPRKKELHT